MGLRSVYREAALAETTPGFRPQSRGTDWTMQAPTSISIVGVLLGVGALLVTLAVIIGAPILAVPFVVLGMVIFFLWRGKRRAEPALRERYGDRVPTTEEAAADPAADSGVREAARAKSSSSRVA
jgi:hypothetical protein